MSDPGNQAAATLRVPCPNCGRELRPKSDLAGKRVRCPTCRATVAVPTLGATGKSLPVSADARNGASAAPAPFGDDFIESALGPVVTPSTPKTAVRHDPRPVAYEVGDSPKQLPLPTRDAYEIPGVPPRPVTPPPEAYQIQQPPPDAAPPLPRAYLRAKAELEEARRAVPPPPRLPFFSGVFTFLFQPEAAVKWIILTGNLMLTALIAFPALTNGLMAMVLFGLSFLMLLAWTVSYLPVCLLPVIEATAAGNDVVEWPPTPLFDRIVPLGFVGFQAIIALTLGWALGWLPGSVFGPEWGGLATILVGFLMFPLLLLSAIESGSAFQPFSWTVFRTLLPLWRGWLTFYALSGGLFAGCFLLTFFGLAFAPLTTVVMVSPLWAAWFLIYARLIGRMAWVANSRG
jgi:ribosomal protein S27E